MQNSNKIYIDRYTIEAGKECSDCLRWFVPIFKNSDPCPHCERLGVPNYPNRIRYLAIKAGISLRDIARISKISWRTIRLASQGERDPHLTTKREIAKALGMSIRKTDIAYIFPHGRKM